LANYHAPICPCGSLRFVCTLVMFPLQWTAKCRCCGRPHLEAHLKLGKPICNVPTGTIRRVDPPDDFWPGF
jgi:hypothetical protein